MKKQQKLTALITGASGGIGEAFARELALRGDDIILVARSEDKLRILADELRQKHQVETHYIVSDLAREYAAKAIYDEVTNRKLTIDLLVNNAGVSYRGEFEELPLEKNHQQIMLNIAALVNLTHFFLPPMLARGRGEIINVGSGAGFYPVPYQAVYAATKAFVVSFSEALWEEYRKRGIQVLGLHPGATDTNVFNVQGSDVKVKKAKPEQVVKAALKALRRRKHLVLTGIDNKFEALVLPRILPRSFMPRFVATVSKMVFKVYKPKYDAQSAI